MIVKFTWGILNRVSHISRPLIRHFSDQATVTTDPMFPQQSYMELSQKFYESMKECASLRSIPIARKLHAQLIFMGLKSSIFLQNHLLNMYSNCGLISDAYRVFGGIEFPNVYSWNTMISGFADSGQMSEAEKLFEKMPERDSVSWNSMMSGYFHNGELEATIKVFVSMVRDCCCVPDPFYFSCVMKASGSLGYLKLALQLHGFAEKFDFGIDTCVETSVLDIVKKALELFAKMPERDTVSWNTMISILSQHGFGAETLNTFLEMWNQGFRPNSMTYASVLSACTSIYDLEWGAHLHARIVRMEPRLDVYAGCGLIDMYAKCGRLESARQVFDGLTEHNAVSWTSLIGGVAQAGFQEEALVLFNKMREVPVASDQFTLATVLGVCLSQKDISIGEQLHAHTITHGLDSSVPVANALVTMYAKCGDVWKANHAFELMPIRDIISWTAMITAFSQAGDAEKPENILIKCQSGIACADLAVLILGNQILAQAEKLGFSSNVSVANSVVTMYSRCGRIEEAQKMFSSIVMKNLVSWNAMMAGYAQNGQGCSHSGFVSEGQYYFLSMTKDHGISPMSEHFVCMVDLLGRAGQLEQAKNLINQMPFKPNAAIWGALLAACRIHGNTKLAELAVKNLLELDAEGPGSYCLLANIYSESGKIQGVTNVRKLMRDKGVRKNPGCSWIEVDNRVHVFTVDDTNHPQIKDVHRMLEEIIKKIEEIKTYANVMNSGRSHNYHSEKLAVPL
ncbi:Pentatricopeptide repeat-containing protein [Vitis vinifera]|uniref:Pentatricopeptide repeat-containing protein n=1 Tax=Vitis vinifera TaxID=29760 RepID=A0A438K3P3_VITVI|nr:Pentatricopeptide repeat-containing protein [Vitis vinifera]